MDNRDRLELLASLRARAEGYGQGLQVTLRRNARSEYFFQLTQNDRMLLSVAEEHAPHTIRLFFTMFSRG